MALITTRALVLREVKYREADKLLTLLSESVGKITVRARGALRRGCAYSAATQQLALAEFTLFESRGRYTINEAETTEQFLGLRGDIEKLSLGVYFAELLEALGDEDSPNPALLRLGLNALFAVSRGLYDERCVKAALELRLMSLAGYEPELSVCSVCGAENISEPLLDPEAGAVFCGGCRGAPRAGLLSLCGDSLGAMRYILAASPKRVFSFKLEDDGARDRLFKACEAYTLRRLERGFGALDYWKKYNTPLSKPMSTT